MRYFLNIKVNVFFLAFGSREPRMTPRVFTYYLVHNFNLGYHTAAGAPVRVYVPGLRKKCPGKYMDGLNAFRVWPPASRGTSAWAGAWLRY